MKKITDKDRSGNGSKIKTILLVIFITSVLLFVGIIARKEYLRDAQPCYYSQQNEIDKMSLSPDWDVLDTDPRVFKKVFEQPYKYHWEFDDITYQLTGIYIGKMPALRSMHNVNFSGFYINNEDVSALVLRFRVSQHLTNTKTGCFVQKMVLADLSKETTITRANNVDSIYNNFCQRNGGVTDGVPLMFLVDEDSDKFSLYMEGNKDTILIEKIEDGLKVENVESIEKLNIENSDLREMFDDFFGKETFGIEEVQVQSQNGSVFGDIGEISTEKSSFMFVSDDIGGDKKVQDIFEDDSIQIMVVLRNNLGKPVVGKKVELIPDRDGKDEISATSERTNDLGGVRFIISPKKKGVVKLSLTVDGEVWPESLLLNVHNPD